MRPCGDLFYRSGITYRAKKRFFTGGGTGRADDTKLRVGVRRKIDSQSFRFLALLTGIGHNAVFRTGRLFGDHAVVPLVIALSAGAKSHGKSDKGYYQSKQTDFFHGNAFLLLFKVLFKATGAGYTAPRVCLTERYVNLSLRM